VNDVWDTVKQFGTQPPSRLPNASHVVAIADKGTGDPYVLLTHLKDASGEYAVGQLDHETMEVMGIVASRYERFVWFLIDDLRRQVDRFGRDRLDSEIEASQWPFADHEWMLQHDPQLAQRAAEYEQ
jgi:hypothetical protein